MIRTKLIAAAALLLWQDCALAQMQHRHGSDAACDEPALRCASKVTPAFASDGTLWLAWMAGGKVSVASSRDGGGSFSAQVEATPERLNLDWGPDARPKIAIDGKGHIALTFAIFKDKAFNGQVLYTHSEDGGKSFASPRPITADNESQRFETVGFDGNGALFATWLDKRNRLPAQQAGKKYEGAALFFASSVDGGASYSDARMAIDNTCECCRLALAFDPSNRPVVVFRNIFEGGVRDHAVITFADRATAGEAHRVAVDDWQIAACPHHGPSLAITAKGSYHVTWFTNGKARKGLFYAHSRDRGRTFSEPLAIGDPARAPSRPYVQEGPHGLAIAWKEFDGERTFVKLMSSSDDGQSWTKPKVIAETSDASDHPLLVADGRRTYLSWMTKADGYRFIPIEDQP
ncbi:MAG: sialidase family protein [Bradyrhizobium sp.]